MDNTKRNVAALGGLTIIAIVVFFWGLYYLLGTAFVRGGMDIYVTMEKGGGIKRGDRTLVEGVIIGSITDVKLLGLKKGVVAKVQLNQKLDLPADTRARIAGDVFGAHTMELVAGTSTKIIEDGDTIRGEVVPMLLDEATGLTSNAREVLDRADRLLSDAAISDIHASLASTNASTKGLPQSAAQLNAALGEMRTASASLRRSLAEIENAKTGAQMNTAIKRVDESAQSINRAALTLNESILSLKSVFAKVDNGTGSFGKFVNDTTLYAELSGAAREFRLLAADIRANPKRYVDLRLF